MHARTATAARQCAKLLLLSEARMDRVLLSNWVVGGEGEVMAGVAVEAVEAVELVELVLVVEVVTGWQSVPP